MAPADLIARTRDRVRRFTRRRRRPLAAALAALGVIVALTSLRAPQAPAVAVADPSPTSGLLRPGEAAVPIVLSNSALVRTVSKGQVVDIVGVAQEGDADATIVAAAARIIDIPEGGSALSASSTPVIVVAVRERDVLHLVATSSRDTVGLVIRGYDQSG